MAEIFRNRLVEESDMAYQPSAPAYVFQEFPKWKYSPNGKSVIVNDAEEEQALEGDWFESPTEAAAFAPVHAAAVQSKMNEAAASVESELDSLIAEAATLDIPVDKRWGLKRLRQEVAKAKE